MYIVLEGIVGCGKSTQSKLLYKYLKKQYPKKEILLTREPGGTEISEMVRKIVQGTNYKEAMKPTTDVYLYASARSQSLRAIVAPVIKRGGIVVADRSFITSLAYQGYVQGESIAKVWAINKWAVDGFCPDIVFYLDIDPQVGLSRTKDEEGDKWEKKGVDFFEKAREGYLTLGRLRNKHWKKWITIDANQNMEQVASQIRSYIQIP